jgi:uncharacterized protein YtpQ (UPF0354 family)
MKTIIAIISILCSSLALAATMSEMEFTQYFTTRAAEEITDTEFRIVRPLQVASKDMNGRELTTFLGNAYAQYSSSPDNLQPVIDSQIRAIKTQGEAFVSKTAESILPVVKPSDYLASIKRQLVQAGLGDKEIPLVYERINDDLCIVYMLDSENSMRAVSRKDMEEMKVNEQEIRAIAIRNMDAYFDKKGLKIQRLENTGHAKIYHVSLDENYEASILLLRKYWNKRNFDVAGRIVVFVPARNMVLVTGSGDEEGVRIAGYLANSVYREFGYAISPRGYVYEAGSWEALPRD